MLSTNSSSVNCQDENKWEYGAEFMKFLRQTKISGLSGEIQFDQESGQRKNLTFRIVDLVKTGLSLVSLFC